MSTKKTVTFEQRNQYGGSPPVYLVVQVKNSTTPKIGERLKEPEVQAYCAKASWDVTIK